MKITRLEDGAYFITGGIADLLHALLDIEGARLWSMLKGNLEPSRHTHKADVFLLETLAVKLIGRDCSESAAKYYAVKVRLSDAEAIEWVLRNSD